MCAAVKTRTAKATLTISAPSKFSFLPRRQRRNNPSASNGDMTMTPSTSTSDTVAFFTSKAAQWKKKFSGQSDAKGVENNLCFTNSPSPRCAAKEQVDYGNEDVAQCCTSAVLKLTNRDSRKVNGACAQRAVDENGDAASAAENGNLLDDYERVCTIGTGTFGRVILVRDREVNKYFALKVMSICDVIHMKQVEHVHSEKKVLAKLNHPFIINLYRSSHDTKCLYMLFDYAPGGELFSYLRNSGSFPNSTCRFYAAEIILALEYLHKKNIVYRDLKPENLLLDKYGHLKLTDFGFAKELYDRQVRTWTLCGTPEYLAPEVIEGKGHNKAVDWWALGILIYEMQAGYPPFYGDNGLKIYEKILEARIKFPKKFDLIAKDLVKKLLVSDRIYRLGNLKGGADDLKCHKWFKHVNWAEVQERKLSPPITPKLYNEGDTGNFDEYDEESIDDIPEANKIDLGY